MDDNRMFRYMLQGEHREKKEIMRQTKTEVQGYLYTSTRDVSVGHDDVARGTAKVRATLVLGESGN